MFLSSSSTLNKKKFYWIFLPLLFFSLLTLIDSPFPTEQWLQQAGTLLIFMILYFDCTRNRFSFFAAACLGIFGVLHVIGTRYIYSYVPYEQWIQIFFDQPLNLGTRNHYDRFVHFAFGVLLFPMIWEVLSSKITYSKWLRLLLAMSIILSLSTVYELFEWSITYFLSPEMSANYNGQQGDIWDAQKDTALAWLGSILMGLGYVYVEKN